MTRRKSKHAHAVASSPTAQQPARINQKGFVDGQVEFPAWSLLSPAVLMGLLLIQQAVDLTYAKNTRLLLG